MPIETYDFNVLTAVIREMFPVKKCDGIYCNLNFKMFNSAFNQSSGFLTGNSYVLKQLRNFADGKGYGYEDEEGGGGGKFDFSSPDNYMYYNSDKKEY
jgi:hypothetical protein